MRKYAVIPTRGDRVGTLRVCLDAIVPQVDQVFLVDNSDHGKTEDALRDIGSPHDLEVIWDSEQPPNLSRLWNLGLESAAADAGDDEYYVAVLNDDAIAPQHWFNAVSGTMLLHKAAAGGFGVSPAYHRTPGTTRLDQRLPGHAFILAGRSDLRADEQFQWWCGDNDLDMQARCLGGTVVLEGDPVRHLFPDRSTAENPVLQARTGEDMRLFVEKWGFRPW